MSEERRVKHPKESGREWLSQMHLVNDFVKDHGVVEDVRNVTQHILNVVSERSSDVSLECLRDSDVELVR